MMRMVDLSSFNPMISDWNAYKDWSKNGENTSGIIIRATEGTAFIDSTFEERAKEALANGIDEIWYYCYSHPEFNTVQEETDYLWQAVKNVVRQDRDTLMLDFEQNVPQAMPSYALAWLNLASYKVRKLPVFYSYLNFIETRNFKDYPIIAKYPLGLAAYSGSMPGVPAPWTKALWWQNSDNGIVPGLSSPVDTDIIESEETEYILDSAYTQTAADNLHCVSTGNDLHGWIAQHILTDINTNVLSRYIGVPTEQNHEESDGYWHQMCSKVELLQHAQNYDDFQVRALPVNSIDVVGIKNLLNQAIEKL